MTPIPFSFVSFSHEHCHIDCCLLWAWPSLWLQSLQRLHLYMTPPAVDVSCHNGCAKPCCCAGCSKAGTVFCRQNNASAAIVQAIHHKVHFLINSSLQACQDSSKGPIQPTALLALCCSLQILEVCTTCLSTSQVLEHCSHILIWLPCLMPQPQFRLSSSTTALVDAAFIQLVAHHYLLKPYSASLGEPMHLEVRHMWYPNSCVTGGCLAGASNSSTSVCTPIHHRAGEGDEAHLRGSQHSKRLVVGPHPPCGAQPQVSPHAKDLLPMYKQGLS